MSISNNLLMKPYQRIAIEECHEPLLPLAGDEFALVKPHAYMACGADYGGKSPYFLRQGSIDRLRQAQQHSPGSSPATWVAPTSKM
jgi:zinc D-Ala-D-Ala dipeptidase